MFELLIFIILIPFLIIDGIIKLFINLFSEESDETSSHEQDTLPQILEYALRTERTLSKRVDYEEGRKYEMFGFVFQDEPCPRLWKKTVIKDDNGDEYVITYNRKYRCFEIRLNGKLIKSVDTFGVRTDKVIKSVMSVVPNDIDMVIN